MSEKSPEIKRAEEGNETPEALLPDLEDVQLKPLPEGELEDLQKKDKEMVDTEIPKLKQEIEDAFSSEGEDKIEKTESSKEAEIPVKEISEVSNLDELYQVLSQKKELTNDRGMVYKAEDLIGAIKEIEYFTSHPTSLEGKEFSVEDLQEIRKALKKQTYAGLRVITSAEGLRDKVISLLEQSAREKIIAIENNSR